MYGILKEPIVIKSHIDQLIDIIHNTIRTQLERNILVIQTVTYQHLLVDNNKTKICKIKYLKTSSNQDIYGSTPKKFKI